jgi:hypothetical protein
MLDTAEQSSRLFARHPFRYLRGLSLAFSTKKRALQGHIHVLHMRTKPPRPHQTMGIDSSRETSIKVRKLAD